MNISLTHLAAGLACLFTWTCLPDLTNLLWLGLELWNLFS